MGAVALTGLWHPNAPAEAMQMYLPKITLPTVVVAAAVDGINPRAFTVLLLFITAMLATMQAGEQSLRAIRSRLLSLLALQPAALLGYGYLVLYNLIFVLPLVIILIAASARPTLNRLAHWNLYHKEWVRLALGGGVVVMGLLILATVWLVTAAKRFSRSLMNLYHAFSWKSYSELIQG